MFSRSTPQIPHGSPNPAPYPPPIQVYPGLTADIEDFRRRAQSTQVILLLSREQEEELFGKEPPEESESVTILHLSKYSNDIAANTHFRPPVFNSSGPQIQNPTQYVVMNSTRSTYHKGKEAKKAAKNSIGLNLELQNPRLVRVKLIDPYTNSEQTAFAWVPGNMNHRPGMSAIEIPGIRTPDIESFALSQGVTELYQWSPTTDINMS